jgi:hypothetical protein
VDPVADLVGSRALTQRESVVEVLLVVFKNSKDGLDPRSGCLSHNSLLDVGALIANFLHQVAEFVCEQSLEESRERQGSASRYVCTGTLESARWVCGREASVLDGPRERGGHAFIVQFLIRLPLSAGHVVLLKLVCGIHVSIVGRGGMAANWRGAVDGFRRRTEAGGLQARVL